MLMTKKLITNDLTIALAQLNPIVGDIEGNVALALNAHKDATQAGADLVLFTELFMSGCGAG